MGQRTTIVVGTVIAVVVLALFAYLMMKKGGSSGGTQPGLPGSIRLSASPNSGGDCSTWNAVLSWSASSGSAPITYTWALYANPTTACSDTGCTGTPVATGSTTSTQVTLDTTQLSGFTSYGAVVTATNAWGQVASTPITVTTGGGFVVDASEVNYLYDSTNNMVVVVGEANTPLPSDGFSATLSVNGSNQGSTTNTYANQTSAWLFYAMQYVTANSSTYVFQVNTDNNSQGVQYLTDDGNTWQYQTTAPSQTGTLNSDQMLDPTVQYSAAATVASLQSGTLGIWGLVNSVFTQLFTLAVVSNGQLCAAANPTCGAVTPAGSFGMLFTDVPTLAAGDELVVSMAAGNSWTGSCDATLPSYTIAGTPPSVPGSITLNP